MHPGNILYIAFTTDSIFSAFIFLKKYFFQKLKPNQLVNEINNLYHISIIDRYTYYLFINTLYHILYIIIWKYIDYIDIAFLITICPIILNHIHDNYIYNIFQILQSERTKLFFIIISKQIAIIINHISLIFIDNNPEVSYLDILPLFTSSYKLDFQLIAKNIAIVSLFNYIKDNQLYNRIFNLFYIINTTNITTNDTKSIKIEIRNIIYSRKWEQLFDPVIANKILFIYYQNNSNSNSNSNFIKKLILFINFSIIKMFSIWSIGAFFNKIYIIPCLSILLIIFKINLKKLNIHLLSIKISIRIIALLISNFYQSYLFISILSEFGYLLVFNKINQTLLSYIYTRIKKYIRIFSHYTSYNIFILSLTLYNSILLNTTNINCYQFYITTIYLFISNNFAKNILLILTYCLGWCSNYNTYHILSLTLLYYISICIYQYINDNQRENIFLNTLNINIFDSYYINKNEQPTIQSSLSKYKIIDEYKSTNNTIKIIDDNVKIIKYVDDISNLINN